MGRQVPLSNSKINCWRHTRTLGSAIHSDTEMATHFNEYFSSVFTCEDTASIPTVDSTSSPLLDDSIEITPATVFSKLIALQSNKSSGPDGWPITIIKSVSEFISVPLSILFNKSLNSGTLPSDWKCANVTPIHKKVHGIWPAIIDQSASLLFSAS